MLREIKLNVSDELTAQVNTRDGSVALYIETEELAGADKAIAEVMLMLQNNNVNKLTIRNIADAVSDAINHEMMLEVIKRHIE